MKRHLAVLLVLLLTAPAFGARDFDGTNDDITCGSAIDDFTNLSVCFRFRHNTSGVQDAVLGKADASAVNGWIVATQTSDFIAFQRSFSGTDGVWLNDVSIGTTLHHYCFVHDGSTSAAVIYIDNVSVSVTTGATPTGTVESDAAATLRFGETGGAVLDLDGEIEDVEITNRVITAAQVNQHFWTGRIDGASEFRVPFRTTKLTNEGTNGSGSDCTVVGGTTVLNTFAKPTMVHTHVAP